MIELRPHHIDNLAYHMLTGFEEMEETFLDGKYPYSLEYVQALRREYERLIANPDIEVRIVMPQLDHFCMLEEIVCPARDDSCTRDTARDEICAEGYGLEIGGVYSMGEILEKIHGYETENYKTPWDRMFRFWRGEITVKQAGFN